MTLRTASSHKARFLLAAAQRAGHDPTALAARYGLDPVALDDVDGRVPLTTVCRMWEELPAELGAPDLPLAVLDAARDADPPLPVLLFLAAPTLGEALARMVRYERVGFDVADEPVSRLVPTARGARIEIDAARCAVPPPAGAVAQTLAAVLSLARHATRAPVEPVSVSLRWSRPPRPEPWRAVFGPEVVFGAPHDRLELARADLARPHRGASRTLSSLTVRHADAVLDALPCGDDPTADVRRALRAHLPDGQVSLAAVAGRLGTSERTLQRRLRSAGTTWRRLLDEERRTLALRWLADPRASVLEVALASGFADATAFGRAVVRWTGQTPTSWRRARRVDRVAPPAERGDGLRADAGRGGPA